MDNYLYRIMTQADIPHLAEIDAEFESHRHLSVEKHVDGLNVTWRLTERPLDPPFVSTDYSLNERQSEEVAARLRAADGLYLVVEHSGRLVALLDMEREHWRDTAMVWNIMIDRNHRRQGLGVKLINRAIEWARTPFPTPMRGVGGVPGKNKLRALTLETQTNNYAACCFYQKVGFKLCGIDDHFYSNDDIGVKEVAIFWWYEL